MSLFGDLDVANAEDDPFKIPDNTYNAYVTDLKVGPTKKGDKIGMTITFTIEDGPHKGKQVQEWKHIPQPQDPKNPSDEDKTAASYLKSRMLDLGVPQDRMNSVTPEDLIGKHVTIAVKNNEGYTNIRKVVLIDESVAQPTGSFVAFE